MTARDLTGDTHSFEALDHRLLSIMSRLQCVVENFSDYDGMKDGTSRWAWRGRGKEGFGELYARGLRGADRAYQHPKPKV